MLVCGNAGARYATVPVELVRQGTGFGASVGAMEFLEALEDATIACGDDIAKFRRHGVVRAMMYKVLAREEGLNTDFLACAA
ncbi:hypothetical protein B0H14DRAFT_3445130 [Mycena olivaceomarginata]|nr:hypothetical protein B0H14DRAFT_3445130 [Mycena olivaceomarginata]